MDRLQLFFWCESRQVRERRNTFELFNNLWQVGHCHLRWGQCSLLPKEKNDIKPELIGNILCVTLSVGVESIFAVVVVPFVMIAVEFDEAVVVGGGGVPPVLAPLLCRLIAFPLEVVSLRGS